VIIRIFRSGAASQEPSSWGVWCADSRGSGGRGRNPVLALGERPKPSPVPPGPAAKYAGVSREGSLLHGCFGSPGVHFPSGYRLQLSMQT
jgi:hypothetical protein